MTVDELLLKKQVADLVDHQFFKKQEFEAAESYSDLPMSVKYRVQALRKLQLEEVVCKTDFEKQLQKLTEKYHNNLAQNFSKRSKIINGFYEPTNSELLNSVTEDQNYKPSNTISGIPNFWLNVLKNTELVSVWIEPHDEPVLQKLKDVRIVFPDSQIPQAGEAGESNTDTSKFVIEFEFSKNEFFRNDVLTKTYTLQLAPSKDNSPLQYYGVDVINAEGSKIEWTSADVNLTTKFVSKKQKNAKTGKTRVVKKAEKQESFFNFFSPPQRPNPETVVDDEEGMNLLEEIEIDETLGLCFRDKVVPYATLIFTEEYEDSDEEDSEEETNDEDDEFNSQSEESNDDENTENAEQPECKQQ